MPTGQVMNLVAAEDLIYRKHSDYYIGDTNDTFVLANKKNIKRIFPQHSPTIKMFIKENKTDFKDEASLMKLCQFINGANPD